MPSTYDTLRAADPAATQRLVEVTGTIFAGQPAERAEWCLRIGLPIAEFDRITREHRVGIDRGTNPPHTRQI
ncbi:hypothetical protein DK419_13210 [Methylobacterium terrae]|uniref:Uncharacterized protein n=1 Tax=Methylobacterium terrae TaxID=2202827 RepID=A0A2U8WLM7_9HYPH|nr:hypothetical protein [Methylobacterium terrae]AWN47155.1 hypothetical protein DK419_13210 [Methylobacterium terrae]